MLLALAVYNFASCAGFPVAGISGIALIIYHLTGLPMGAVTLALNIPIVIFCYKFLGRDFFIRSVKTMIISSILLDYVAPLLPVYEGDRLLAAICTGVLQGLVRSRASPVYPFDPLGTGLLSVTWGLQTLSRPALK